MSHQPKYITIEEFQGSMPAIKAGKTGTPEVITNGGAKASNAKIVFTGNLIAGDTVTIGDAVTTAKAAAAPSVGKIVFTGNLVAGDTVTVNGKAFTCMASGAAGQFQFNVDSTLALSLAALNTVLNACTDALVSYATYTVTDTNTSITSTSDTNNSAFNSVVLASSHSTVVVTQPTGGVSEATAVQFDVAGTLSASLDALVTKLNASTDPLISLATYSKTDTNTALTIAWDSYGVGEVVATNHSTAVLTQAANGKPIACISLDTEHTQINWDTFTADLYLNDGDESQRKTISMFGSGTCNIISPNDLLPGTTNNYALNGNDVLILQFLGGKWRLILNDGATAS